MKIFSLMLTGIFFIASSSQKVTAQVSTISTANEISKPGPVASVNENSMVVKKVDSIEARAQKLEDFYIKELGRKTFVKLFGRGKGIDAARKNLRIGLSNTTVGCSLSDAVWEGTPYKEHLAKP